MYDVVACGFEPAPLAAVAEHAGVLRLPSPRAADFVELAFDVLADRSHERVLLVHEAHPESTRRIRTLRAMLQSVGVVPVPLRRPLTGLASHATWLAGLAGRDVPAGLALVGLPRVQAHLPTYAATTSVARLALPQVRMHHHVLSWVPGTIFGVTVDGDVRLAVGPPAVVETPGKVTSEVTGEVTSGVTSGVTGEVAGGVGADLVWSGDRRLEPQLARTRPVRVGHSYELRAAGERPWWGTARAYEHTVVPGDLDDFAATLHALEAARCPQCGEAVRDHCSFCNALEGVAA